MLDLDLESANKLTNYLKILRNKENAIRTDNNSMSSQIVNVNIDNKDRTNEMIYIRAEQIKFNIDIVKNLMRDTSIIVA